MAEFERDLISERVKAGLESARARGRTGGRKPSLTPAKVRTAQAAMKNHDTVVSEPSEELGISTMTLYLYVAPNGDVREAGRKVLKNCGQKKL